jgi:hypothetical protein
MTHLQLLPEKLQAENKGLEQNFHHKDRENEEAQYMQGFHDRMGRLLTQVDHFQIKQQLGKHHKDIQNHQPHHRQLKTKI